LFSWQQQQQQGAVTVVEIAGDFDQWFDDNSGEKVHKEEDQKISEVVVVEENHRIE
jgi:hypothetical protein